MKKIFKYIASKANTIKTATVRLTYWIWGTEIVLPEAPKELPLNSLSPVADADKDGVFCDTLYWALKNRKEKDIKNIAITGPYGSGKSSLLKTFKEKHKNDKDLKFLNISLATFKEEKEDKNGKPSEEDLLRLIELSILQQLFYFEKNETIPDSRFKKIKSLSKVNLWITTLLLLIFTVSLVNLINPCFIKQILLIECKSPFSVFVHYPSLLTVLIIGFLMIFKSIRVLRNITIKSFRLNDNAEFEISESINKSILNHHLDEVLYFFQVTNYTVVIIEDLDRFEQTEIFTKLRELNLLINNSRKINRYIVFIYAVRDELFRGEKERTKFFDFIIPIIPVINSSNSVEKLLNIVQKSGYPIKNDLIEDVALFIDDMRLLFNITNEYYLYAQKLGSSLDQNKLFAMMVYKNLYPDDFVELGNSKGKLFKFFEEKNKLFNNIIEGFDEKAVDKKNEIKKLEQLHIVDILELRKLFLFQYISQLPNITHFILNGTEYPLNQIDDVANDEDLFEIFIENEAEYKTLIHIHSNYYNTENQKIGITFVAVGDLIDPEATYFDRLELINDFKNDKTEVLRKEISELERQKIQIKNQPLKSLLQKQSVLVNLENSKQQQLVNILLRNGYIDEHYHDYISIFYEGSITKEDREYLLNVKAQISSEHSYKLVKITNLIGKINPTEFDQPHILNYDLVDYLFGLDTYQDQKKGILRLLSNESESSTTFLKGFLDVALNKGNFIKSLTEYWSNYWKSISKNSVLPQDRILMFLTLLLEHGEIKSIIAISKQSDLKTYLEAQSDFFVLIDNQKKLFEVVEKLDLQFKQFDLQFMELEDLKFLEKGNYYDLNPETIRSIVQTIGNYNEETFDIQNYYALQESGCDNLWKNVNTVINDYITRVYLKLPKNTNETEECLQKLINDSDLYGKNKVLLLQFTKTKIALLQSITKLDDQALLFVHSRISPIWTNIIHFYHNNNNVFNNELIGFLNKPENVSELAKTKIDLYNKNQPDLATVKKFIPDLLRENQIQDGLYTQLLKSIPAAFNRITELQTVDHGKMVLLIDKKILNLTEVNYQVIRENYSDSLHIKLIRLHTLDYISSIMKFEIDSDDLHSILIADDFSMTQKSLVVNSIDQELILSNYKTLKLCNEYVIESSDFNPPKEIVKTVLLGRILPFQKHIQLFNIKRIILSNAEVLDFLDLLPEPFSEMGILGKRPTIPDNTDNLNLVEYIKTLGLIKDYKKTNKGIKISTYRKNNV